MEPLLLSVHVVAGILFVGPVAVTTSLFPRYAHETGAAQALHRITRVYGLLAITVPTVGLMLAVHQDRLSDAWVVVAMLLTAVAGLLLALRIAPLQARALADPATAELKRLNMLAGVFNLLWAAVVVLMVVRPGSSS